MNHFEFYKDYIAKGRNKSDRPLANNTRAVDRGDSVSIRLHGTDVVTFHENGDTSFDTGGWYTVTTKDRMGFGRDFQVWSVGGVWHIAHHKARAAAQRRLRRTMGLPVTLQDWPATDTWDTEYRGMRSLGSCSAREPKNRWADSGFFGELVEIIGRKDAYRIFKTWRDLDNRAGALPFFDGIRFTARGRCVNPRDPQGEAKRLNENEALRKSIRRYSREVVDHLKVSRPVLDRGDCFYCQIDIDDDTGHLRTHVEESYVPSALIIKAFRSRYRDTGVGMWLGIREDADGNQIMGGPEARISARIVELTMYGYLSKALLPDQAVRATV